MKSWVPIPSFCHHSLYKAQVERVHFKEKSTLLKTGMCCLHLLEVVPHATSCMHHGTQPFWSLSCIHGIRNVSIQCASYCVDFQYLSAILNKQAHVLHPTYMAFPIPGPTWALYDSRICVLPFDTISLSAPFAMVLGLKLTLEKNLTLFQNKTAEYFGNITYILNY